VQVASSSHTISNFSVAEESTNMFRVKVEFDWNGLTFNDEHMIGRTQCYWLITVNPAERFAKIKTIDVELLVPF
jgi:hypothetical protein